MMCLHYLSAIGPLRVPSSQLCSRYFNNPLVKKRGWDFLNIGSLRECVTLSSLNLLPTDRA
jgi:hypothetical protein